VLHRHEIDGARCVTFWSIPRASRDVCRRPLGKKLKKAVVCMGAGTELPSGDCESGSLRLTSWDTSHRSGANYFLLSRVLKQQAQEFSGYVIESFVLFRYGSSRAQMNESVPVETIEASRLFFRARPLWYTIRFATFLSCTPTPLSARVFGRMGILRLSYSSLHIYFEHGNLQTYS
jgi:hypothetical protein